MTRISVATLLLVITMTISSHGFGQTPSISEQDSVQIRAALKGMDDTWNRHDMKAFVSFMADDVEWVNVVGMWWKGKTQVYQAHDAFHKTIFKTRQVHAPEIVEARARGDKSFIQHCREKQAMEMTEYGKP